METRTDGSTETGRHTRLCVCERACVSGGDAGREMAVSSAWQALSPLQWARWGWDSLLGGAGAGGGGGGGAGGDGDDPTLGLLHLLSGGSHHDYMIRAARGPARQR